MSSAGPCLIGVLLAICLPGCASRPDHAASPTPSSSLPPAAPHIDRHISNHAAEARLREIPEARLHVRLDVDGDTRIDDVVIYRLDALGGAPTFYQFLASWNRSGRLLAAPVRVGQADGSSVSDLRAEDGVARLSTLERRPGDAPCCPTGRGIRRFAIQSKEWVELKNPAAPSPGAD